jgi:hypothetical protein
MGDLFRWEGGCRYEEVIHVGVFNESQLGDEKTRVLQVQQGMYVVDIELQVVHAATVRSECVRESHKRSRLSHPLRVFLLT